MANQPSKIANIKCRERGCPGMTAKVVMEQPNGVRMYVCTVCNIPQTMSVGQPPGFVSPRPPIR